MGWIVFLPACTDGQLQGAKAEVKETTIKLDLPKVPDFDMPSPHPDGTHTVREMRLKGRKLFNTEQRIRGFVTWQYDCVAALRTPELTSKQVKRMIANDPSRCVVPHFYLGDGADTPAEKSLWVVEVPRKLRKDELRLLTRRERRKLPSVPVLNLGDEVVVIGTWDKLSPRGFANSDGLLVYKSIEVVTRASNRRQGSPDDEG
ncbi:MAG: hypothetical protein MJE77_00630 [Proteobacteria bacterium]|nr:hypothetical protein [Pseudomonadota bacterium]